MKLPSEHYKVEQNTDEWYNLRVGKITASNFGKIMANYPKKWGNPAEEYAIRLAIERSTGKRVEEGYTNEWMKQGHENEPIALELYELETFEDVTAPGIFINGDYGASPDGLINDNGQVEVKSVKYNTHFARLKKGGFDTKYKWQIQGNLGLSGRDWCDYISYCSTYNEDKQLYVFRVYPDQVLIDQLFSRLEQFNELVNENLKLL